MAEFCCAGYTLVDGERLVKNPNRLSVPSNANEVREEEEFLAELSRYVEYRLQSEFGMIPITIPDTDSPADDRTTILATANWTNAEKLLVITQNSSGSILGIFSRTLCKKEGLSKGSILPYVARAVSEGYEILILRPNTNSVVEIDPESRKVVSKRPIRGSESPEIHALYVLENIIPQAENVRHIALLGYGNGASLCKYILSRQLVRSKEDGHSEENRIKAMVTIEASHIIDVDDTLEEKQLIERIAINLECDAVPRGHRLGISSRKLGCACLSLGLPTGQTEIQNVASSIFLAIDPVFEYLRISETVEQSSLAFAEAFARSNGHDPATAVSEGTVNAEQLFAEAQVVASPEARPVNNRRGSVVPGGNFFTKLFGSTRGEEGASAATTSVKKSNSASGGAMNSSRREGEEDKLDVNDFDLLKVVGQGAFGKVMLVRKKEGVGAGQIYAMKVLKKSVVAAKGQVEHTKSERSILCEIRHPFIVRLRFAFQSEDKLYLITDYYNGGSLFYHLRKSKSFSEDRARFYAAELLSALDHLHQQHIIYRDLKLENILMDHSGHIALTDFGLSKQNIDVTGGATTFCGTAEYIAPELLRGHKYGAAVDWWSFGILLFEMIHGRTPFYDKNRKLMFYRIIHTEPNFPSTFSTEARECCRGLLRVSESERLGSGESGAQEIMRTPFFRPINFAALFNKEIPPPFIPEVKNEFDTKYVPKAYLKTEAKDSFSDPTKAGVGQKFEDFTFKGDSALDK